MTQIPQVFFRHQTDVQLIKHTRPPTKKDLGTKLRTIKPYPTTLTTLNELFAVASGLPEEDASMGIDRDETGALKPFVSKKKETGEPKKPSPSFDLYKVKLQDPTHVAAAQPRPVDI